MALCTPAEIEQEGGLTFNLFNLPDQATLDAFIQKGINESDAWMVVYLGSAYGGATTAETMVQSRAQRALTMAYFLRTLKQLKLMGVHYPVDTEDSPNFEQMIVEWEEEAKGLLAKWIAIDTGAPGQKTAFARPYFGGTLGTDPLVTDSEDTRLRALLDEARSLSTPDLVTVTV